MAAASNARSVWLPLAGILPWSAGGGAPRVLRAASLHMPSILSREPMKDRPAKSSLRWRMWRMVPSNFPGELLCRCIFIVAWSGALSCKKSPCVRVFKNVSELFAYGKGSMRLLADTRLEVDLADDGGSEGFRLWPMEQCSGIDAVTHGFFTSDARLERDGISEIDGAAPLRSQSLLSLRALAFPECSENAVRRLGGGATPAIAATCARRPGTRWTTEVRQSWKVLALYSACC